MSCLVFIPFHFTVKLHRKRVERAEAGGDGLWTRRGWQFSSFIRRYFHLAFVHSQQSCEVQCSFYLGDVQAGRCHLYELLPFANKSHASTSSYGANLLDASSRHHVERWSIQCTQLDIHKCERCSWPARFVLIIQRFARLSPQIINHFNIHFYKLLQICICKIVDGVVWMLRIIWMTSCT